MLFFVNSSLMSPNLLKAAQPTRSTVAQADIRGLDTAVLVSVHAPIRGLGTRVSDALLSPNANAGCAPHRAAPSSEHSALLLMNRYSDGACSGRGGDRRHAPDIPHERRQLARHRHHRNVLVLAGLSEFPIALAQPQLRVPSAINDGLG